MAEVGLLPFARIALQVANAVLPRYRSRFSKHQFTQPQLLAGGWRSINRVGLPMIHPLFTQFNEDLGNRLMQGAPPMIS